MSSKLSTLVGRPAQAAPLVDVAKLVDSYTSRRPDPAVPAQRLTFGTSGHRGSSLDGSFRKATGSGCPASTRRVVIASIA